MDKLRIVVEIEAPTIDRARAVAVAKLVEEKTENFVAGLRETFVTVDAVKYSVRGDMIQRIAIL
jgi:hypothetical protein